MDNIELDFLLMMIEKTGTGEYRDLLRRLEAGEYDDDLKLAFNRARRLRRWFERNAPSPETREIELKQAARGYDHFFQTDVRHDERFASARTTLDRLTIAYRIVDEAHSEIEAYVEAAKEAAQKKGP
ncbi:MAG: hypothetical protein EHM43_04610 [Ignavibacteriae bacterium]|nr:MAG: hypothetical protein EHM43_04610 [Ignavibacteriota bacterium]